VNPLPVDVRASAALAEIFEGLSDDELIESSVEGIRFAYWCR
jgi:hypothetical protein